MNFFDSLQVKKKEKTGQKAAFDPFGLGSTSSTSSNPTNFDTQQVSNQQGGWDANTNLQSSDNNFGSSNTGGYGFQPQKSDESTRPSQTGSKKFAKFAKKKDESDNAPPMFISNANFESLGMEDPSQRKVSVDNAETTSNHSGTGKSEKSDHSSQPNQETSMNFKRVGLYNFS